MLCSALHCSDFIGWPNTECQASLPRGIQLPFTIQLCRCQKLGQLVPAHSRRQWDFPSPCPGPCIHSVCTGCLPIGSSVHVPSQCPFGNLVSLCMSCAIWQFFVVDSTRSALVYQSINLSSRVTRVLGSCRNCVFAACIRYLFALDSPLPSVHQLPIRLSTCVLIYDSLVVVSGLARAVSFSLAGEGKRPPVRYPI